MPSGKDGINRHAVDGEAVRAIRQRRNLRGLLALLSVLCALGQSGCAASIFQLNPAFPLSAYHAREALDEIEHQPLPLERPVVIFAGFGDPGFGAYSAATRLRAMVADPDRVLTVTYFGQASFDECRDRAIREIEAAFPSDDPAATVEIDAIGISMGGLVVRHAARDRADGGKVIRIRRLFSIGTPHRGANLAWLPTLDERQVDMRPGSAFLEGLNADATSCDFEIVPYGRLGDGIVGVENVAPPGEESWWVPNLPLHFSHLTVASDPRIVADIMRRLRNEAPYTVGDPVPPPE